MHLYNINIYNITYLIRGNENWKTVATTTRWGYHLLSCLKITPVSTAVWKFPKTGRVAGQWKRTWFSGWLSCFSSCRNNFLWKHCQRLTWIIPDIFKDGLIWYFQMRLVQLTGWDLLRRDQITCVESSHKEGAAASPWRWRGIRVSSASNGFHWLSYPNLSYLLSYVARDKGE